MLTNETRRNILNRVRASGYPGGVSEAFRAAEQGIDVVDQFVQQQQLEQQNITVHATIDPQQATGISFILPTASKDRVVLVWRGANAFFEQSNVPDYVFKNKEGIYLSSLTGHSAHAFLPLVQRAKKEGMMVATNPGTSQLKKSTSSIIQSLAYIDLQCI